MLEETLQRDHTRSVMLVDAENLFHHARAKTPRLLRALDEWAAARTPLPLHIRTYGFPPAVATNWERATAIMDRLGIVHVPNTVGPDHADRNLQADFLIVRRLAVQIVLGTGDLRLLERCFGAGNSRRSQVSWIILNPTDHVHRAYPFAPGQPLHGFPASHVVRIDLVYRDWLHRQARDQPFPLTQTSTRSHLQANKPSIQPGSLPWSDLRPAHDAVFDEAWRQMAISTLGDVPEITETDARHLVSTLQSWLPLAVPDHYDGEFDYFNDDAWKYHCISAVFAKALLSSTPTGDIESRLLSYYLAHPEQTDPAGELSISEASFIRAQALVRQRQAYTKADQARLLSSTS